MTKEMTNSSKPVMEGERGDLVVILLLCFVLLRELGN